LVIAFDKMILNPGMHLEYLTCVIFTSVSTAQFTPICANPLAADVKPVFCTQRMFHVASKKVPLSPDQGDPNETDIVVDNCPINKLINPKTNSRISFSQLPCVH
jgi:hypothetical protein